MKNMIKISTLSALMFLSPLGFAQTPVKSIADQQLQLMKEGYQFVEPSLAEKNAGIFALYHKGTSSEGIKGGLVSDVKNKTKNWSTGSVRVDDIKGYVGDSLRMDNYVHVTMQNESEVQACVKYHVSVYSVSNVGHQEDIVGCMNPYARYDADWDVFAYIQYNYRGNFPINGTLDIYDYVTTHREATGFAYIS